MRTRERLLEVLLTVNPEVHYKASVLLGAAAYLIEEGKRPSKAMRLGMLQLLTDTSPHIVQLAAEALHYLKGEQRHG